MEDCRTLRFIFGLREISSKYLPSKLPHTFLDVQDKELLFNQSGLNTESHSEAGVPGGVRSFSAVLSKMTSFTFQNLSWRSEELGLLWPEVEQ